MYNHERLTSYLRSHSVPRTSHMRSRCGSKTMVGGNPLPAVSPAAPVLPLTRAGVKVSRNDPCPCGSGKKFKNCCHE